MKASTTGTVFKYGDAVNTDVIFPGKYTYTVKEPADMAAHAMEDLDPAFATTVNEGDIVVGGENFGCGSSREQAAFCLRYAGVGAVIAKSFARLYFRNAINAGLPAIACPEAVDAIEAGDEVTVDLSQGSIVTPRGTFSFPPFSKEAFAILADGGLIPHTRKALGID